MDISEAIADPKRTKNLNICAAGILGHKTLQIPGATARKLFVSA
jgi:hypothetical protein